MGDDELINGMLNGSKEAFDEFYSSTKDTVEKVCAYFLGEDAAMVGAAVAAYTKAFHLISQKKKPDLPPKAWMSVLAVQECFPVMARYREDYDTQTSQMEEMANKVPVLQEITTDSRERLSFMVRGEVEDLPDPHKEFLSLSELQGLSFLEIAKRLSSSWSTVVTRLFTARQLLGKRVKEQLGI
jgi:DNA-directed RNA polymerase specialized sigma24 family protein